MQKSKSDEKCQILAKYWKVRSFSSEKLPNCIRSINDNWMLEFQGENIMTNNFHVTLEPKYKQKLKKLRIKIKEHEEFSLAKEPTLEACNLQTEYPN